MAILITNCTILPMCGPAGVPQTFTGSAGIAGNRIAMVAAHTAATAAGEPDPAAVREFRAAYGGELQEIDGRGMLLMPGLINTHCHAAMTLQRSYADDIALMSWLNDYIWPFERKQLPAEIATGAELGIAEMLLGGVTAFVDMYWSEDAIADAVIKTGIRAMLGVSYMDANIENLDRDLRATLAKAEGCSRLQVAIAPHAGYSCSPDNLRLGVGLARKHNLHMTSHIAETTDEQQIVAERYGMTPVQLYDSVGALDGRMIAAHCVHVDAGDIALLAARGVSVAHNPQSNLKLSSGIAPLEAMRRAGVNCTVSTDGPCSNNDLDLWDELRTAAFAQKYATGNPCSAPAYEMLRMVTCNAAQALGYGGELGIIREGALADVILIDLRKPHLCTVHDPVATLVYCGKAADVDTVIVDGRIVVEGRRLKGWDLAALMERVRTTTRAIIARQ